MNERRELKHIPINNSILLQQALSLYKDFDKECPETSDTKLLT
jgi:hypothetical protein